MGWERSGLDSDWLYRLWAHRWFTRCRRFAKRRRSRARTLMTAPEGMPLMAEMPASAGGAGAPPVPSAANRAPDLTREYEGDGITVEWYATRCIHSAKCVHALPRVFDPRRRPWVDPSA